MNRRRPATLALLVASFGGKAGFCSDQLHLAATAQSVLNMRAASNSLQVTLTPQGLPGTRVAAGRVVILHARDDAGRELGRDDRPVFHHDSAGGGNDSYDVSASEPI